MRKIHMNESDGNNIPARHLEPIAQHGADSRPLSQRPHSLVSEGRGVGFDGLLSAACSERVTGIWKPWRLTRIQEIYCHVFALSVCQHVSKSSYFISVLFDAPPVIIRLRTTN